jgi:hypothetical protein
VIEGSVASHAGHSIYLRKKSFVSKLYFSNFHSARGYPLQDLDPDTAGLNSGSLLSALGQVVQLLGWLRFFIYFSSSYFCSDGD